MPAPSDEFLQKLVDESDIAGLKRCLQEGGYKLEPTGDKPPGPSGDKPAMAIEVSSIDAKPEGSDSKPMDSGSKPSFGDKAKDAFNKNFKKFGGKDDEEADAGF